MKKLTKREQDIAEQEYLDYQLEYNQTGNKEILWNDMRPILLRMVGSAAKKIAKNHFIPDYEDRLEATVDRIIARYIRDQNYNKYFPKTLAYWAALGMVYNKAYRVPEVDNYEVRYDTPAYIDDKEIIEVAGNVVVLFRQDKEFYFHKKGERYTDIITALEAEGWDYIDLVD